MDINYIVQFYLFEYHIFQNCYIHNTGRANELLGDEFDIGNIIETTYYDYKNDYKCIFRNITSVIIRIRVLWSGNELLIVFFMGMQLLEKLFS